MPDGTCSDEGCDRPIRCVGLCSAHYARRRRETERQCSIEGCVGRVRSKGWCKTHYERWRNHGDPHKLLRRPNQRAGAVLAAGAKICSKCGIRLPLESFGPSATRGDGRQRYCRPCSRRDGNKRYRENPKLHDPDHSQELSASRYSQISGRPASAAKLRELQRGLCAICGTPEADVPGGRLHLDHDHATSIVRGLLCTNCNIGLGHFQDSPTRLLAAVSYLRRIGYSAMP